MRKKIIILSCFLMALLMIPGCASKSSKSSTGTALNSQNPTGTKVPQNQAGTTTPPAVQPVPNQTGAQNGTQGGPQNNSGTQYNTPSSESNNTTNSGTGTNVQPNQTSNGVQYMSTIEQDILTNTNAERQKAGLPPLTINTTAFNYARSKSEEMIRLNYFDHKSPVHGYITDIAQKDNWKYSAIGENIYTMTFSGQRVTDVASGQKIVQSWMNSPGHRANILNKGYTQIGIGVAYINGKVMATQIFYTP